MGMVKDESGDLGENPRTWAKFRVREPGLGSRELKDLIKLDWSRWVKGVRRLGRDGPRVRRLN